MDNVKIKSYLNKYDKDYQFDDNNVFEVKMGKLIKKAIRLSLKYDSKVVLGVVRKNHISTLYTSEINPKDFFIKNFFSPNVKTRVIFNSDYENLFRKANIKSPQGNNKTTDLIKNINNNPENSLDSKEKSKNSILNYQDHLKGIDEINPELAKFLISDFEKNKNKNQTQSIKQKLFKLKIPDSNPDNNVVKSSTKLHFPLDKVIGKDDDDLISNFQREKSLSSNQKDNSIDEYVNKFYKNSIENQNVIDLEMINKSSNPLIKNDNQRLNSEKNSNENLKKIFGGICQVIPSSIASLKSQSSKTYLDDRSIKSRDSEKLSFISYSNLRQIASCAMDSNKSENNAKLRKTRYDNLQITLNTTINYNSFKINNTEKLDEFKSSITELYPEFKNRKVSVLIESGNDFKKFHKIEFRNSENDNQKSDYSNKYEIKDSISININEKKSESIQDLANKVEKNEIILDKFQIKKGNSLKKKKFHEENPSDSKKNKKNRMTASFINNNMEKTAGNSTLAHDERINQFIFDKCNVRISDYKIRKNFLGKKKNAKL